MVAFELAQWHEKAGEHAEAARWYTAAAERFRRSQWKTKAEAALARLRSGAAPVESAEGTKVEDVPEAEVAESGEEPAPEPSGPTLQARPALQARPTSQARPAFQARAARASDPQEQERVSEAEVAGDVTEGEPGQSEEMKDQAEEMEGSEAAPAAAGTPGSARPKPRRRGRRGGRNRRRGPATASGAAPAPARVPTARPAPRQDEVAPAQPVTVAATPPEEAIAPSSFAPAVAWRERSRAGEPALASRMAQLESQVRRLLACPPVQLDLAETAPAGPGVLLLSDSDQVTHYYIESCQTLRIAIANLTRGGRGAKDNPKLRERLGENLGIAESRVASYLKEHCAVRWLQLDEGASHLAHFAIAVLRPVVNE